MTTTSTSDLIIAPTTEGASFAGRTVWWDLKGGVPLAVVRGSLLAAGIKKDLLPVAPTIGPRLLRACTSMADHDQLVRPVRTGAFQGGYALVTEGADKDGFPVGGTSLAVRVNRQSNGDLELEFSDPAHPKAEALTQEFTRAAETLTGTDISAWLANALVPATRAVRLRRNGGFYFIPADACGAWAAATGAVAKVTGCEFYDLDAHTKDTAIKSVLKAITREAEEGFAKVAASLSDGTGKRGLKSRDREMERLADKLSEYERTLGVTLSAVKAKATMAKNSVAAKLLEEG